MTLAVTGWDARSVSVPGLRMGLAPGYVLQGSTGR